MYSEGQDANIEQETIQHDVEESKIINCPNCNNEVPATLYCLNCGRPLFDMIASNGEEDDRGVINDKFDVESLKEIQDEKIETSEEELSPPSINNEAEVGHDIQASQTEEPVQSIVNNESNTTEYILEGDLEMIEEDKEILESNIPLQASEIAGMDESKFIEENASEPEEFEENYKILVNVKTMEPSSRLEKRLDQEPSIAELAKEFMNSISLKLWAIDLLLENSIKEDQFNNVFDGYNSRYKQCLSRREEMLKQALDLKEVEKKLDEAKIKLGELEVRKSIGDLYIGEYDVMAPALEWTINHCEEEIENRNKNISLLEDLTQLIPSEKILKMKELFEKMRRKMNEISDSWNIGSETASRLRGSLEEIQEFLNA
jgi:hypothetical protein